MQGDTFDEIILWSGKTSGFDKLFRYCYTSVYTYEVINSVYWSKIDTNSVIRDTGYKDNLFWIKSFPARAT